MPNAKLNYKGKCIRTFRQKSEIGLTLIELLVTLAITGFIITALYTFYLTGLNSWNRAVDQLEYQQTARIALDKIISELRYAQEIEIVQGSRQMLYFYTEHNGKKTLFRFRLAGGQLFFEQRKDFDIHYATNVVALGIENLLFSIDGDENVHITITAGEGLREVTLSGTVRPRNIHFAGD